MGIIVDKIILLLILLNGALIASDASGSGSNTDMASSSNTELQARNKPVVGDINKFIKIGDREKVAIQWLLSSLSERNGPDFVIRQKDGNFIDCEFVPPAVLTESLMAGNWVFYPKASGMYTSNNSKEAAVFVVGTKDPEECSSLRSMCQRRLLANAKLQ